MQTYRIPLLILIITLAFLPFSAFSPLELVAGVAFGLGAISIADMIGAVKPQIAGEATVFDPKEWPKYIAVLLIEATGFYLYRSMGHLQTGQTPHIAGVAFILLVVALPAIILFIIMIRNSNDKVILTPTHLNWEDNEDRGSVSRTDIGSVAPVYEHSALIIPRHRIRITLKNGGTTDIPVYRMNFTRRDTTFTAETIQHALNH